jgi:aspartyl-tRNA(Asn)/glutamyl-tRNA(Gln) amidotransferase subunit B
MRGKEEANDYRYFPDPDLLPVVLDPAYVDAVRDALPELEHAKRARLIEQFGLGEEQARFLTASPDTATYFEQTVYAAGGIARTAANWIMGEMSAALNRSELEIAQAPVDPASLATILARLDDGTLSASMAKQVFEAVWKGDGTPEQIIESRGLRQISDSDAIGSLVDQVLADNPGQVEQYRAGKHKVLGFLVGQVMKASKGTANPQQVNAMMREKLDA